MPECLPWQWTDHAARCWREALALLPDAHSQPLRRFEAEFAHIREEMARLPSRGASARLLQPVSRTVCWSAAVLTLALPVLGCGFLLAQRDEAAPAAALRTQARALASAGSDDLIEQPGPDGTVGLYERYDDGFGNRYRGPLKRWDVPKPATIMPLAVTSQGPATAEQKAFAAVSAELLLAPYPRQGRDVLLVVAVPRARDPGPGFVIYDSAKRQLSDGRAYRIATELKPSTWYSLTGREVVFLGVPRPLEGDNSLAVAPPSPEKVEDHDRSRDLFPP
jgi:hypothetical protein